jgi:hypothetical protein
MTPGQRAAEIDSIQAQLVRTGQWPAALPRKPRREMTRAELAVAIGHFRAELQTMGGDDAARP